MVTSMGANTEITTAQIDVALDGMMEHGVLLTQFEIPVELALYASRTARKHGKTAIINPAPAPEAELTGLDAASILVPNETEALSLLGMDPTQPYEPLALAEQLYRQTGAECVIVTLGESGAVGCDATGTWQVTPPRVQVVDTSGAGDVFCAALAVALIDGQPVRTASGWACVAASLSVTRPGTIPAFPTRDELERFLDTAYGGRDEIA
jgi:ribokinase